MSLYERCVKRINEATLGNSDLIRGVLNDIIMLKNNDTSLTFYFKAVELDMGKGVENELGEIFLKKKNELVQEFLKEL